MILAPDNPEKHLPYAEAAFPFGKPVFVDKTFASDYAEAKKIFALADANCPMFSSSALRFSRELEDIRNVRVLSVFGCGTYETYAVHIFEIIVRLMGIGAKWVTARTNSAYTLLEIDYGNGRKAFFHQADDWEIPFSLIAETEDGVRCVKECTDSFLGQMNAILEFFDNPQANPVKRTETLEIAALIEAGNAAKAQPGRPCDIVGK